MRIVRRLYADTKGIGILQKPEKLYLYHPNIFHALSYSQMNVGSMRESFFISQLSVQHAISHTNPGDFKIDNYTFEIGGKSKSNKQIKDVTNAYIVSDDIEIGNNNKIPLWLFGFLY